MGCTTIIVSPAHSPRVAVTLERQSNQTLIGKRLLYAQGHAAQCSEQHRPGSFAPLTFAQANPSAKFPMPLPAHNPPLFCPLLAEAVCRQYKRIISFCHWYEAISLSCRSNKHGYEIATLPLAMTKFYSTEPTTTLT